MDLKKINLNVLIDGVPVQFLELNFFSQDKSKNKIKASVEWKLINVSVII
jgi:hypothetical protein